MATPEQFDAELKQALKSKDGLRLSVIRMIKSSLKYREIEKMGRLSDEDVLSVLSTLAKQRRESIEQFRAAGRSDLADKEQKELDIILGYLPRQLPPQELDELIRTTIRECAASTPDDVGKVMKLLMPKVKGAADGQLVNRRVRELLALPQ